MIRIDTRTTSKFDLLSGPNLKDKEQMFDIMKAMCYFMYEHLLRQKVRDFVCLMLYVIYGMYERNIHHKQSR